LADKLRAELPGILNWALLGVSDWSAKGLADPAEVTAATADYRLEMDVLGAWLGECCIVGPTCRAKSSDLYASYKTWCERNGERPLNQRSFGMAMTEKGYERFSNNGVWYRGVGL
jgi:putative DNA primase/helicase